MQPISIHSSELQKVHPLELALRVVSGSVSVKQYGRFYVLRGLTASGWTFLHQLHGRIIDIRQVEEFRNNFLDTAEV